MATTCCQIAMGHNLLLIQKVKNKKIRKIYAEATLSNGWSRSILDFQSRLEIAKNMIKKNMKIEDIIEIINLSKEEIEKLKG